LRRKPNESGSHYDIYAFLENLDAPELGWSVISRLETPYIHTSLAGETGRRWPEQRPRSPVAWAMKVKVDTAWKPYLARGLFLIVNIAFAQ
jgi:hypothetical protein